MSEQNKATARRALEEIESRGDVDDAGQVFLHDLRAPDAPPIFLTNDLDRIADVVVEFDPALDLHLPLLARVEGSVVATRKHPSLEGWRLLICQPIGRKGDPEGAPQVALDAHGAGMHQRVVISSDGAAARKAAEETIRRLAIAAEFRDDETARHIQRMSLYCALLARLCGLDPERCELIRIASPMHDIGKIGTPDNILLKPGKFTPEEFKVMTRHAEIGHRILFGSEAEVLKLAASIAWTHHESFDGTGYPRGLVGEAIPLEGRIAAIADAFDALTNVRPYKAAWPVEEAIGYLQREAAHSADAAALLSELLRDMELPRRLQIEFSQVVQRYTDSEGGEVSPSLMWSTFSSEYLEHTSPLVLHEHRISDDGRGHDEITAVVEVEGDRHEITGSGNGPIAAFVDAVNGLAADEVSKGNVVFENRTDVRVLDYHEHALSSGGDALAAAYVECTVGDQIVWGVGVDANIVTASLKAVISAVNRA